MAIEIVDFPIKNGDFPWQNVSSPEGMVNDPVLSWLGGGFKHLDSVPFHIWDM